jgi:antitoxin YefM
VLVTRNGKPLAALVPIDDYEALDETVEILSESGVLSAIEAGLAELSREEIVTLEESRPQLTERRQARTAHDSSSSTATGGSSTP